MNIYIWVWVLYGTGGIYPVVVHLLKCLPYTIHQIGSCWHVWSSWRTGLQARPGSSSDSQGLGANPVKSNLAQIAGTLCKILGLCDAYPLDRPLNNGLIWRNYDPIIQLLSRRILILTRC
ncbi:hypothetical protein Peur_071892 [Populus x canadensis]